MHTLVDCYDLNPDDLEELKLSVPPKNNTHAIQSTTAMIFVRQSIVEDIEHHHKIHRMVNVKATSS